MVAGFNYILEDKGKKKKKKKNTFYGMHERRTLQTGKKE
jgi:hypothetical protein